MESYPRSHRLPEPRNEPSLFVIVYVTHMVYWWIDYPRHSTASHIRHWVSDRDMHGLTNLDHSSHQAGINHSDRTQNHPLNVPHTGCVWIEAVWTMESNQIYRSSCRQFMTKGLPLSLNIGTLYSTNISSIVINTRESTFTMSLLTVSMNSRFV